MSESIDRVCSNDYGSYVESIKEIAGFPVDLVNRLYTSASVPFGSCPTPSKVKRACGTYFTGSLILVAISAFDRPLSHHNYKNDFNYSQPLISLFAAALLLGYTSSICDFNDPLELEEMRRDANLAPWDDLMKKYGIESLRNVLSKEEIRQKFEHYFSGDCFSKIVSKYSLDTIHKYELADFSEKGLLREAFNKEMDRDPLSLLRCDELKSLPIYSFLTRDQSKGLITISKEMKNMDALTEKAISVIDDQFSLRFDKLIQGLQGQEKLIDREARRYGKKMAGMMKCSMAPQFYRSAEENRAAIRQEIEQIVKKGKEVFTDEERGRIGLKILTERFSLKELEIAYTQQDLYDSFVKEILIEQCKNEELCVAKAKELFQ